MDQQGGCSLHDSSTSDLRMIINAGEGARNIIIARQKECEEIEVYNPTHYQISLDYLNTTRKRKLEAGERSTQKKQKNPPSPKPRGIT